LWHIGLMQRVADIPTWLGQYEKSMAPTSQGGGGETEERAIAIADQAVLDSQGGGTVKDLATEQRGRPVARLFMTFYSYGNTIYNATSREIGRVNPHSPASVLRFLGNLSLIYVMPAVATVTLARAFGRKGGDDDGWREWMTDIGQETMATALNTMVLVRELGVLVQDGYRGYSGAAGMRAIGMAVDLGTQIKQGELDTGLWKAANSTAGILLGYPALQAQRSVDGFVALQEGRTKNPAALIFGGPPKKKTAARR